TLHRTKRETLEFTRPEQARPRFEDHEGLSTRFRLGAQVRRHGVRELVEQALRGFRVRVEERARGSEFLRRPAADEIAEERERRARKADERRAPWHVRAHETNG